MTKRYQHESDTIVKVWYGHPQLWIKWNCKLYLEEKVQLDLIPYELNIILSISSERLMASLLFRIHDSNWRAGRPVQEINCGFMEEP